MARILYECRDIETPSGGIRRLYRHVEILVKHGYPAAILHWHKGFQIRWFDSPAPVCYWSDELNLGPDDVLVIPEGHANVMAQTAHAACRRVVIALSWSYIYRDLAPGADWRDFGITDVIAGSSYVHDFIQAAMGIESTIIRSGIDLGLFRPVRQKRCQIAYMPRKNRALFHMIQCIFRSRFREYTDVPFVAIDAVTQSDVAAIMAESAIFLATGFPEGLARPPLEAMASGCIVVGFAGRGSMEYMTNGVNCYVREDYDALGAALDLGHAVEMFRRGHARAMQNAALHTAREYSISVEEVNVSQFWSRFMGSDSAASIQQKEHAPYGESALHL